MRVSVRRWLISAGVSALVLLMVAPMRASIPVEDDYNAPNSPSDEAIIKLHQGVEAVQTFPVSGKVIVGVSVQITNFARIKKGSVEVALATDVDGRWTVVRTQSMPKEYLRDESFNRFRFKKALKVRPGQLMSLTVKTDGSPASKIGWFVNPHFQQAGFSLQAGGVAKPGIAQFAVHYKRASGTIAGMLPRLWRRLTIFLHLFGKSLLVGGFGLALVGLVHALLWPPKDEDDAVDTPDA